VKARDWLDDFIGDDATSNQTELSGTASISGSPVPSPDSDSPIPDLDARVKALDHRVVKAREAYRCCKSAKLNGQALAIRFALALETMWENQLSEALVFSPAPAALRSFTVTKTVSSFRIAVTGKPFFQEFRYPATLPELQLQTGCLRGVAEAIRKTEEDCLLCIESKLLPQSAPRQKVLAFDLSGKQQIIDRRMPGGSAP